MPMRLGIYLSDMSHFPPVWLAVVIEADIAALLGDSVCCPAKAREEELQKQAGDEFEAAVQHPLLLARR